MYCSRSGILNTNNKKEEKKLREENEKLVSKIDELNDRYTRMLAEYDNFRKRAQKEREGI